MDFPQVQGLLDRKLPVRREKWPKDKVLKEGNNPPYLVLCSAQNPEGAEVNLTTEDFFAKDWEEG